MRFEFLPTPFRQAVGDGAVAFRKLALVAWAFQEAGMIKSAESAHNMLRAARDEPGQVIGAQKSMPRNEIKNSEIPLGELNRRTRGDSSEPWLPRPRMIHLGIIP